MRNLRFISIIFIFFITVLPSYSSEQQIVPGNVLNITVLGYPELSKSVVVHRDGTTDYPLLVSIPISGMSTSELSELLYPTLMRYVERPRLFINILDYLMLDVKVWGEVRKPGPYTVQGPIDLQGVISTAGGPTEFADLRKVKIIRENENKLQEISVDLFNIFSEGEATVLPEINEGDIVVIPIATTESYVRVMGKVRIPGTYLPRGGENIADMINKAGGALPEGNMNDIIYITKNKSGYEKRDIKLKKLINKGLNMQIPLVKPGDLIIVGELSSWRKASYWASIIRDTSMIVYSILLITRV